MSIPAFPQPRGQVNESEAGMMLRDWFAGKALNGILSRPYVGNVDENANLAYRYAEAMMKARK